MISRFAEFQRKTASYRAMFSKRTVNDGLTDRSMPSESVTLKRGLMSEHWYDQRSDLTSRDPLAEYRRGHDWLRADREWAEARTAIGADDVVATTTLSLGPVLYHLDDDEVVEAEALYQADGCVTARMSIRQDDRDGYVLWVHYPPAGVSCRVGDFMWLEPHTRLAAWLLLATWRVSELADHARDSFEAGDYVATASNARSLLENAAVMRHDALKLDGLWEACLNTWDPSVPFGDDYEALNRYIDEVLYGAKWKEVDLKTPARVNALTALEKLEKTVRGTTHAYDWLCNLVHPSAGSTMLYTSRQEKRANGLAMYTRYHRGGDDIRSIEAVIEIAINTALRVATETVISGVSLLDDVGLTSGCPPLARFSYWRQLTPADPCPCILSTLGQSDRCNHKWHRSGDLSSRA